jgi:starch phosphorylase
MKAAANGSVNVSVLDGWWAEAFDGENGFGIAPAEDVPQPERNQRDALQLFEMLEQRVIAEYYGAAGTPPSADWLRRVRRSMRTALERYSSARMLEEYKSRLYMPASSLAERLRGSRGKAAVNLARWRKLVLARWPGVRLEPQPGESPRVHVATHGIPAESIVVEAEGGSGARHRMALLAGNHEHAEFGLAGAVAGGVRAYRAWPEHELLAHPLELGLLLRIEAGAAEVAPAAS